MGSEILKLLTSYWDDLKAENCLSVVHSRSQRICISMYIKRNILLRDQLKVGSRRMADGVDVGVAHATGKHVSKSVSMIDGRKLNDSRT